MYRLLILLTLFLYSGTLTAQQTGSAKPRVLISTDIGGTDPDDNQSMIHLLMYSDMLDLEGLVSSPSYGPGSKEEILRMIDLYKEDLPRLKRHRKGFPSVDYLRSICKQGRRGLAPFSGYASSTEGSDWIVQCAQKESDRPLWVLVWGGLEDLAQALHDAPEIQNKIRVYWIGGPNKKWSANSYAYIAENFPDLWFIEANATYRGLFSNNKNYVSGNLGNEKYKDQYIRNAGALGKSFNKYYEGHIKMGDTPSLLYVMNGNPNDPYGESWGGQFEKLKHSSRVVFNRTTTLKDTIPVYSVMELHLKGPKVNMPPDSACFTMAVQAGVGEQKWAGYYLGKGQYVVRYAPKKTETLSYRITSDIRGFPDYKGQVVVSNTWPGPQSETDYQLGANWYTDLSSPEQFDDIWQGAKTVLKWRNEALLDWAERWQWLQPNWGEALKQKEDWYSSEEAIRIADNLLIYQLDNGGWPKNINMAQVLGEADIQEIRKKQQENRSSLAQSTIDNRATHTQMRYLAKVFRKTGDPRFKESFLRGIDYLLEAQYENGGWPQFYPLRKGYYSDITFNDGAMMGVMDILSEIAKGKFDFVDSSRISKIQKAIDKGLELILKTQIEVDGELTAWCAQYDPESLKPAKARAYEHPSISGSESVGVVRYLMKIENPGPEVIKAINSAVAWFEKVKITGIRIINKEDASAPKGFDRVIGFDPESSKPYWARFYEIGTNYPIFSDRSSEIKYAFSEIDVERRTGYSWLGSWPEKLIEKDYPSWCKTWGIKNTQ